MSCITSLFRSTVIGTVLASELAIASMAIAVAPSTATTLHENRNRLVSQQAHKQSSPPPPRRNPGSSAAGGRRNPTACPQDEVTVTTSPPLTALSPMTSPSLTLEAHPTFLIYVPRTSAEAAEFSLSDREGRGIYRTTIPLTNTPDIISITVPDEAEPLEVGRPYMWVFSIICNPDNRMSDQFVMDTVQRTELDPTRLRQIEQAPTRERITLYQEDDIWYDPLALLFELRRSQPDDPDIATAWREFLQSGGVDTTIDINPARPR